MLRFTTWAALAAMASLGCSSSSSDPAGTGGAPPTDGGTGGAGGADAAQAICTTPTAVLCSDQVFQEMNLKKPPAPGNITSTPDGAGFSSTIDATAGGAFNPNPDSYVYGRFDDTGLLKVDIGDEEALDSMDWDIAFRRYVMRINSGHSGPSCVTAARLPGAPVYDDLTQVPAGLTYRNDEYFTASCEIIPDGSGLPNSPATALSSYWTYPGCVQMTGNVFVVRVASGRQLKLTVTHYYDDANQQTCNTTGAVPQGTPSATFQMRWSWLD